MVRSRYKAYSTNGAVALTSGPPGPRTAGRQEYGCGLMVSEGHGRIADTAAEVDATFRTQRRVVLAYFAVFLLVTLAVPALTLVLDWWYDGRLVGGMSPAFVMTAVGLYVFFFLLAVAAASLQSTVEDRMLGAPPPDPDGPAE